MTTLSEDEKKDIEHFHKHAWFHSAYFELWKILWVGAMCYFGWNVAAELLGSIRDWWHYKPHERDTWWNSFLLIGLFFSWIAYSACEHEERYASAGDELNRTREEWLKRRKLARDRGDTEALKEQPFKRYGILKFIGMCILGGSALLYLYGSKF